MKTCQTKKDLIFKNAKNLYAQVVHFNSKIKERCCDFKLLEQSCLAYQAFKEVAAAVDMKIEEPEAK